MQLEIASKSSKDLQFCDSLKKKNVSMHVYFRLHQKQDLQYNPKIHPDSCNTEILHPLYAEIFLLKIRNISIQFHIMHEF